MLQELLQKIQSIGIDPKTLSTEEEETLNYWNSVLEQRPIGIGDVQTYLRQMITQAEVELVDTKEGTHESIIGKARLKNLIFLETFVTSQEKAKKAIEKQLEFIRKK